MKKMKNLAPVILGILIGVLATPYIITPVIAQNGPVILQVLDSATRALVSAVGDTTNSAIRVNAIVNALPTGAATAAKQPALGTAGSSSADVITIQGIASGTVVPISVASLPLPSTAATSTKQSDGTQKTQIVDGSGNVITSTSNALNMYIANGSATDTDDGTVAGNQASVAVAIAVNYGYNGTNNVRITAGTADPASNAVGLTVRPVVDAVSECVVLSAASTNSTNCKSTAGSFFGYELYNTTTTVYYLRLYNASSAPTCSSATGFIRSIPIPPGASAGLVSGAVATHPIGVAYATGVGYCITASSTSTANDNAAVGLFGVVRYK